MGVFHVFKMVQMVPDRAMHHIYLFLFQNAALKGNLLPKHISTKFPGGIPYD